MTNQFWNHELHLNPKSYLKTVYTYVGRFLANQQYYYAFKVWALCYNSQTFNKILSLKIVISIILCRGKIPLPY